MHRALAVVILHFTVLKKKCGIPIYQQKKNVSKERGCTLSLGLVGFFFFMDKSTHVNPLSKGLYTKHFLLAQILFKVSVDFCIASNYFGNNYTNKQTNKQTNEALRKGREGVLP